MAVELYLRRCKKRFDYIFLDPPFPYKFRLELLEAIDRRNLLADGGMALVHHPKEDSLPERIGELLRTDQRAYGRSIVDFFKKSENKP